MALLNTSGPRRDLSPGNSMGRDMADSFHVGVGNVPPVPNLGPDQGWVGMSVQFLVDAAQAGAEHVVFGRAVFAPGQSEHQWHRHPGAEEFVLLVRGQGIVLDGDNEIPVSAGDVAFHRQGAWHGFRNTSASEYSMILWAPAAAAFPAATLYHPR